MREIPTGWKENVSPDNGAVLGPGEAVSSIPGELSFELPDPALELVRLQIQCGTRNL